MQSKKIRKKFIISSNIFNNFVLDIFSCTLKDSSVTNVCLDILDYQNQIPKDAQSATALVWEMFARVAILLHNQ